MTTEAALKAWTTRRKQGWKPGARTITKKKHQVNEDFELIEIETTPRNVESIRHSLFISNYDAATKALINGGSEGLRNYYNNLGSRRKIGNWLNKQTRFVPAIIAK